MRLNLQKRFFVIFIVAMGFILYSCVDEPYIEPVKRPFTLARVGNFTNVGSLELYIDGEKKADLARGALTNVMEIQSGNRDVALLNQGDTVFSGTITMNSYHEQSLLFGGYYYSKNENIDFVSQKDGITYVLNEPAMDTSGVRVGNFISVKDADSIGTNLHFEFDKTDAAEVDTFSYRNLETMEVRFSGGVASGNYDIKSYVPDDILTAANDSAATESNVNVDLATKKRYYIITSGELNNLNLDVVEFDPLAPRSK